MNAVSSVVFVGSIQILCDSSSGISQSYQYSGESIEKMASPSFRIIWRSIYVGVKGDTQ